MHLFNLIMSSASKSVFPSGSDPLFPNKKRGDRRFYRYGGHIEFIRFKEYYGMPRGHEHDLIYSLSIRTHAFWANFS